MHNWDVHLTVLDGLPADHDVAFRVWRAANLARLLPPALTGRPGSGKSWPSLRRAWSSATSTRTGTWWQWRWLSPVGAPVYSHGPQRSNPCWTRCAHERVRNSPALDVARLWSPFRGGILDQGRGSRPVWADRTKQVATARLCWWLSDQVSDRDVVRRLGRTGTSGASWARSSGES